MKSFLLIMKHPNTDFRKSKSTICVTYGSAQFAFDACRFRTSIVIVQSGVSYIKRVFICNFDLSNMSFKGKTVLIHMLYYQTPFIKYQETIGHPDSCQWIDFVVVDSVIQSNLSQIMKMYIRSFKGIRKHSNKAFHSFNSHYSE